MKKQRSTMTIRMQTREPIFMRVCIRLWTNLVSTVVLDPGDTRVLMVAHMEHKDMEAATTSQFWIGTNLASFE